MSRWTDSQIFGGFLHSFNLLSPLKMKNEFSVLCNKALPFKFRSNFLRAFIGKNGWHSHIVNTRIFNRIFSNRQCTPSQVNLIVLGIQLFPPITSVLAATYVLNQSHHSDSSRSFHRSISGSSLSERSPRLLIWTSQATRNLGCTFLGAPAGLLAFVGNSISVLAKLTFNQCKPWTKVRSCMVFIRLQTRFIFEN